MAAALSLASLPASRSARAAARSWSLASVAALLRGAASSSKYLGRVRVRVRGRGRGEGEG